MSDEMKREVSKRIIDRAASLSRTRSNSGDSSDWFLVDRSCLWDAVEQEVVAMNIVASPLPIPPIGSEGETALIDALAKAIHIGLGENWHCSDYGGLYHGDHQPYEKMPVGGLRDRLQEAASMVLSEMEKTLVRIEATPKRD